MTPADESVTKPEIEPTTVCASTGTKLNAAHHTPTMSHCAKRLIVSPSATLQSLRAFLRGPGLGIPGSPDLCQQALCYISGLTSCGVRAQAAGRESDSVLPECYQWI